MCGTDRIMVSRIQVILVSRDFIQQMLLSQVEGIKSH